MSVRASATRTGGTWKAVTCEHCPTQFAYYMTTTVTATQSATPFSPLPNAIDKAASEADHELVRALDTRVGWVWCPECGRYPRELVPVLRWRATRLFYFAALVPILAGLVYAGTVQSTKESFGFLHNLEMSLLSFPFESGVIWFGVAAAVVAATVYGLSRRYQPNADADARAGTRAHSDVLLRQEYESRGAADPSVPALTW